MSAPQAGNGLANGLPCSAEAESVLARGACRPWDVAEAKLTASGLGIAPPPQPSHACRVTLLLRVRLPL